jgi:sugar phosphate isomerase/epimerase
MNGNRILGVPALSRREFLGRATSAVAAGTLAGGWLAAGTARADGGPWKMRLSASSIAFTALPIEKACGRIASLGFEAIDVWSAHAGCPHLDDALNRLGADGLMQLLANHKLKLYAFSVYAGGYARYAELLGKCGGGVAVRGSAGPCRPNELTARMKTFIEQLKPEVELAEKHNSYLAV